MFAVGFKTRNRAHDRTRSDDDVFRVNRFLFAAVKRDFDFALTDDFAEAVEDFRAVFFIK